MARATRKVLTGEFRLSYPVLFTARPNRKGELKYSLACVFENPEEQMMDFTDSSSPVSLVTVALELAKEAFGPQAAEKIRKEQLKWPFTKGEKKDYPEGSIFFNAYSNEAPGVVSRFKDPETGKPRKITDPKEVYPGVYGRAVLTFYSYENEQRGIAVGLDHVQILRDGERLDNRRKAEDSFSADDEALASLDDVTGEQEEKPAAKKAAPKAAAKKSSVLDDLND
jgi:hypothetical protein